jgi:hypothetical protein
VVPARTWSSLIRHESDPGDPGPDVVGTGQDRGEWDRPAPSTGVGSRRATWRDSAGKDGRHPAKIDGEAP